jgi:hypothetical protein
LNFFLLKFQIKNLFQMTQPENFP